MPRALLDSDQRRLAVLAAPELLEALGSLVLYLESDPGLYDGDDDGSLGRRMFAAQAAIDKATEVKP